MALIDQLSYARQVELYILLILRQTFLITLLIGKPAHKHDSYQGHNCDHSITFTHNQTIAQEFENFHIKSKNALKAFLLNLLRTVNNVRTIIQRQNRYIYIPDLRGYANL